LSLLRLPYYYSSEEEEEEVGEDADRGRKDGENFPIIFSLYFLSDPIIQREGCSSD